MSGAASARRPEAVSPCLAYPFDHAHDRPPRELADLLGGKGANLAEMTSVLRIPVPPGFTVTTRACTAYLADGWPPGLDAELDVQVAALERAIGRRLDDARDPLLVSVRSGASASMPGMLDTVLNLGLTPATADALAARTDARFAFDTWRRFILMYARIVLEADPAPLEAAVSTAVVAAGVAEPGELGGEAQRALCERLLARLAADGRPLPDDPRVQLRQAVEAVFRSWSGRRARTYRAAEGIPDDLGTAVNVQAMVFGNRDDCSGTGVAFTRDAATGEARAYGDFLLRAQGEDVVAGIRATGTLDDMAAALRQAHAELVEVLVRLEAHYRDMCDTEFTVESGRLWMLQTRVGKRTARAALRMAVEMAEQDGPWRITRAEALARVDPAGLAQLAHPWLRPGRATPLAVGLPASPGVAVGRAYLSADAALDAADRGEAVILVRPETSPDDVHGMQAAEGVLTSRGGLVSHAAVVARGWNLPAVVGAEAVEVGADAFIAGGVTVHEGDEISLDGATGAVFAGRMEIVPGAAPPELARLLAWAREAVGAGADAETDPAALLTRARAASAGSARAPEVA